MREASEKMYPMDTYVPDVSDVSDVSEFLRFFVWHLQKFSSLALKLSAYVRTSLGCIPLKGFGTKVKIKCGRPPRSQNLVSYGSYVSENDNFRVFSRFFVSIEQGFGPDDFILCQKFTTSV